MGLIKCPDCGGNVSTEAPACPHCGRPIAKSSGPAAASNVRPAPAKKKRSSTALGCLLLVGLAGVMLCVSIINQGTKTPSVVSNTEPSSESATQSNEPIEVGVFTKKKANIRVGPGTEHAIARVAGEGVWLKYSEKSGEWYKLAIADGQGEEWIHESLVLTEAEQSYRSEAELKIGDWGWRIEYDYAIAEGQVTNVSGVSLESVAALVTFQTADGGFITSSDALIDYNPILPGQTSPWKVMTRYNPAMKTAHLEFKTLFGGTLRSYKE